MISAVKRTDVVVKKNWAPGVGKEPILEYAGRDFEEITLRQRPDE